MIWSNSARPAARWFLRQDFRVQQSRAGGHPVLPDAQARDPAGRSVIHADDLERFLGVCRVVKGLRGLRLGAVGARPGAFNTVRYSEKILERHGIGVTTVDLSEFLGQAGRLDIKHAGVAAKLESIRAYAPAPGVPEEKLVQMAKLGVVLDDWMEANAIAATAIQCWTSVQQNYGCNVCTLMSMMSERFLPSACEVDVTGVLTMYAMQLAAAARRPGGLEQQLRR
jgi:L-fucose isomerase-like protein